MSAPVLDGWIADICSAETFEAACKAANKLNNRKTTYTNTQLRTSAISQGFLSPDAVPEGNNRLKASWIGLLIWNYLNVNDVPHDAITKGVTRLGSKLFAESAGRYMLDNRLTLTQLSDAVAAKVAQDDFRESAQVAVNASIREIQDASKPGAPETPLKKALQSVKTSPVPDSLAKLLDDGSWDFRQDYTVRKKLTFVPEESALQLKANLAKGLAVLYLQNMGEAKKQIDELRTQLRAAHDENKALEDAHILYNLREDLRRQKQFYEMEKSVTEAYDTAYEAVLQKVSTGRNALHIAPATRQSARDAALASARMAGYLVRAKTKTNMGPRELATQIKATEEEYTIVTQLIAKISELQAQVEVAENISREKDSLNEQLLVQNQAVVAAHDEKLAQLRDEQIAARAKLQAARGQAALLTVAKARARRSLAQQAQRALAINAQSGPTAKGQQLPRRGVPIFGGKRRTIL